MVKAALAVPSWLQDEMSTAPQHTEEDLVAAVAQLRIELEYSPPNDAKPIVEGNAQVLLNALQKSGLFKSLTIAQVKKVDLKAMRNAQRDREKEARVEEERRMAQEQAALEQEREEQEMGRAELPRTDPSQCKLSGDGLSQACARQPAYFWVEAFDSKGRKRPVGGDVFFVAIRGPSRVKARITDNGDGTYLVLWKPWCSGDYNIAISLYGALLPGAPFNVNVVTTLPCPTKCIARGNALTHAVSRHTHVFEVLFKDRLGAVAHAVDLDVFVEPLPATSPRNRKPPEPEEVEEHVVPEKPVKKQQATAAPAPPPPTTPQKGGAKNSRGRRGSDTSPGNSPGGKRGGKGAAAAKAAVEVPSPAVAEVAEDEAGEALSHRSEEEDVGSGPQVETKYRKLRVRVGEKPLILRADVDKASPMIGRLMPGAMVTVIEERIAATGEVRATIVPQLAYTPNPNPNPNLTLTLNLSLTRIYPRLTTRRPNPLSL